VDLLSDASGNPAAVWYPRLAWPIVTPEGNCSIALAMDSSPMRNAEVGMKNQLLVTRSLLLVK
jgi:hypothetical protein